MNPGPSQHPADRLIRELIQTGRRPTPSEFGQIIERLATVPFDRRLVPVPLGLRGLSYQGQILGARADSLTCHLVRRVVDERQWASGTTAAQYVSDLRRAVRAPNARLAVYRRRGGHIAIVLAPTDLAVPTARRAAETLPEVLVVYSADRGIILSGYQVTGLAETGVPEDALWLR